MPIKYSVHKNSMNKGEERYRAVVKSTRTVGLDGVLERMQQQGSVLSSGEVLAAWHGIKTAVASLMLEGVNVNTDLFNCSVSIRGNFDDAMDHFDKKRHQVHPVVNAGTWLKDMLTFRAKVVKQEARIPGPNLNEYQDCNSGRSNKCLTPGGMGRLLGSHLKVDPDDPQQGIFFIAQDGQTTRVEVLAKNVYSELIFLIPANLSPGTYRLQVRSAVNQSELRIGDLSPKLTVTAGESAA